MLTSDEQDFRTFALTTLLRLRRDIAAGVASTSVDRCRFCDQRVRLYGMSVRGVVPCDETDTPESCLSRYQQIRTGRENLGRTAGRSYPESTVLAPRDWS